MGKVLNINRFELERAAMKLGVPATLALPIIEYVFTGTDPGAFLRSVLQNDLCMAAFFGDAKSLGLIKELVGYLPDLPRECWSDKDVVDNWIEQGGLEGKE